MCLELACTNSSRRGTECEELWATVLIYYHTPGAESLYAPCEFCTYRVYVHPCFSCFDSFLYSAYVHMLRVAFCLSTSWLSCTWTQIYCSTYCPNRVPSRTGSAAGYITVCTWLALHLVKPRLPATWQLSSVLITKQLNIARKGQELAILWILTQNESRKNVGFGPLWTTVEH